MPDSLHVYNILYKQDKTNGLFKFLRNSKKYSIHKNIIVKNNSLNNNSIYDIFVPFGLSDKFSWMSAEEENSWLMVSFPNFRVKVDSYAMKSYKWSYPSSWKLYGKNNGEDWKEISFVEGRTVLPEDQFAYVNCSSSNYYSSYKISMIGIRSGDDPLKSFEILLLEFFGSFITSIRSCSYQRKMIISPLVVSFFCLSL